MPRRNTGLKEKIRALTAELFAERGYHGVGLREIATGCGIAVNSITHHFGQKDNLYAEAVRWVFEEKMQMHQFVEGKPLPPQGDPQSASQAMLELITAILVETQKAGDAWHYQLAARVMMKDEPQNVALILKSFQPINDYFRKAIENAGVSCGEEDLKWFEILLWSEICNVMAFQTGIKEKLSVEEYSEPFLQTIAHRIASQCTKVIGLPQPN